MTPAQIIIGAFCVCVVVMILACLWIGKEK